MVSVVALQEEKNLYMFYMWSHTYWVRQQGSRQIKMLRIKADTPEWKKFHVADFMYEIPCVV